jgi:hypothetical protein
MPHCHQSSSHWQGAGRANPSGTTFLTLRRRSLRLGHDQSRLPSSASISAISRSWEPTIASHNARTGGAVNDD